MIVNVGSDLITNITNYTKGIFGDMSPIVKLILGIALGMFIIEKILDIVEERLERKARQEEIETELEAEALAPVFRKFHEYRVKAKREEIIEEA